MGLVLQRVEKYFNSEVSCEAFLSTGESQTPGAECFLFERTTLNFIQDDEHVWSTSYHKYFTVAAAAQELTPDSYNKSSPTV